MNAKVRRKITKHAVAGHVYWESGVDFKFFVEVEVILSEA
jgi:hypothetical protein